MDLTRFDKVDDYSILDSPKTNAERLDTLFSVFDDLPVLALAINQQAQIAYLNPEGSGILNSGLEQCRGQCWLTSYIPSDQRQELILVFEQVINGNIEPFGTNTNDILTADGSIIPFKWTNHLLKSQSGSIKGICCFGSDSRSPTNEVDRFVDLNFPASLK